MDKITITLSKNGGKILTDVYDDIMLKIFFFDKTFFSFKSSNGILYYRDSGSREIQWTEAIFDVESGSLRDGEKKEIDFLEIFNTHISDVVLDESIPFTFAQLKGLYQTHLNKFYKKSPDLLITLLFYVLINKENRILINSSKLTKDDKEVIDKLTSLDYESQIKFMYSLIKHTFKDELFEKFLANMFSKKDSKMLSKINTFFDGKVNLPGKYLVKHNELILESLLIPKK